MERSRTGILLLNLGTPKSPEPPDVAQYLKEFLMDPFVIDIPHVFRWILVHLLIVPRRSKASSKLYKKIWTDSGSPLLMHTVNLARAVQEQLPKGYVVQACMRYGQPSIRAALEKLRADHITELTVFPLYPQFSFAATQSSIAQTRTVMAELGMEIPVRFIEPFYGSNAYLNAVAEVSRPHLAKPFDKVLFSFHGLPENQVKRAGHVCTFTEGCCERIVPENKNCYRAQSYATARELAVRLSLSKDQYLVGFQSRLGGTPWIQPYSDEYYRTLPSQGVRRLAVISPSFVADCLETVEEIALRGRDEFLKHGGEDLFLIPSLNSEMVWVQATTEIVLQP